MTEPRVEQLVLPQGYGSPSKLLDWAIVEEMLVSARHYWLASTRPDGRPHVVPRDGVWVDDALYYGGSPQTIHYRNVSHNNNVSMHVGDGWTAVIVEGTVTTMTPDRDLAVRLAAGSQKYAELGYAQDADAYRSRPLSALRARRVLAWTTLYEDATRFVFAS